MTKAEELKILEQIEKLIADAGADSYIRMTFAGVPEICRSNIENDFADIPVEDLRHYRETYDSAMQKKDAECGQKLLKLEHERDVALAKIDELEERITNLVHMSDSQIAQMAELRNLVTEWEQNAHDAGELYAELEAECEAKDMEIVRLKAELYDYMKGAK